ncbi:MAG: Nif11-like leader peptide family natural product precursor [Coleofasciculus sp. S288]|nr:Nif11-like leader peptide family natural product precursor [Coleofasciculus sp. S288]
MSKETVRQFLLMASSDAALQNQLAAASDLESFVKLGHSSGYNFTMGAIRAA